jgi:transposase-like protein
MATRESFELSRAERNKRTFSESFKREKVKLIERGSLKVSEICKMYHVSGPSVYKWLNRYGTGPKNERLIVENNSETKVILDMQKRLADLERLLGQKQIEIEFYKKMIDLAEDHYEIDIKKNSSIQPSDTSGTKGKNKPSV